MTSVRQGAQPTLLDLSLLADLMRTGVKIAIAAVVVEVSDADLEVPVVGLGQDGEPEGWENRGVRDMA